MGTQCYSLRDAGKEKPADNAVENDFITILHTLISSIDELTYQTQR